MGSSSASAECLRAILREDSLDVVGVVTQPDRPAGRGKTLTPCACAEFAEKSGVTSIIKPENINEESVIESIRAWRPDVVVVVAFGQILKKQLLDLPLFGCINCHFSLLPKYRGAAPVIAALEAGDRMTGVSVMRMGEGLDDGPVMLQSFEPIYPDTTGGDLMCDLAIAGGVTLAKALKLMSANRLPREVEQDHANATYVKKLKKSDGLINWDSPVIEIERKIRAYNPWPCCYTFLPRRMRKKGNTGRLVVMRGEIVKLLPHERDAAPGSVLRIDSRGPVVKCHDTALLILDVKVEGGSRMDAGAFLRGRPLVPGEDSFVSE